MIPHLFAKEPIPPITNPDLHNAIDYVKKAESKEDALKRAFETVTSRYKSFRFGTYLFFWKAWEKDPNRLWQRTGYMHCTQQNYLLRLLLIKSGWFGEEDIDLGYSLVGYISPHQYLKVYLDKDILAADPWNAYFRVPLGSYAHGFGYRSL